MGEVVGGPLWLCMNCGCSRMGNHGLVAACEGPHGSGAKSRSRRIGKGLHPSGKVPVSILPGGVLDLGVESEVGCVDWVVVAAVQASEAAVDQTCGASGQSIVHVCGPKVPRQGVVLGGGASSSSIASAAPSEDCGLEQLACLDCN